MQNRPCGAEPFSLLKGRRSTKKKLKPTTHLSKRATALRIAQPQSGPGWMLSLANEWVPIRLNVDVHSDGVGLEIDPTEAGQSGSPILDAKGCAIGVIVVGTETTREGIKKNARCGGKPILTRDLPVRFFR